MVCRTDEQIRLLIIGAVGHGSSVAEAAELLGAVDVVGFLDDLLHIGAPIQTGFLLESIVGLSIL